LIAQKGDASGILEMSANKNQRNANNSGGGFFP